MPTAAIITAAIGAGGAIGGAAISSHAASGAAQSEANAASHAADVQGQSAQQALDFAKQVYGQRRQDLSPYTNLGSGAVGKLSDLLGIQMPAASSANTGPFTLAQTGGQSVNPNIPISPFRPTPQQQQSGAGQAGSAQFVGGAGRPDAAVGGTAPGGTGPGMTAPAGSVLMEAPDGTRRLVPSSLVGYAILRKARIV